MDLAGLRRAFRARPDTAACIEFAAFLEGLGNSESAWRAFARILERDVVPVVARCHPGADGEDIESTCLAGAFEVWVSEWCDHVRRTERVRSLMAEERVGEAFAELTQHPRTRGPRLELVRALWNRGQMYDALKLIEGKRSARGFFIARTRARIGEAQRKQRRQSILLSRNCFDLSGLSASGGCHAHASTAARSLCGAELESESGERSIWRISALQPAHLLGQELADRVRRMLAAIEDLGPEHARVFKLLVEGLSQTSIAEVEGRHPAAISRRVQHLRDLCRTQLLG